MQNKSVLGPPPLNMYLSDWKCLLDYLNSPLLIKKKKREKKISSFLFVTLLLCCHRAAINSSAAMTVRMTAPRKTKTKPLVLRERCPPPTDGVCFCFSSSVVQVSSFCCAGMSVVMTAGGIYSGYAPEIRRSVFSMITVSTC